MPSPYKQESLETLIRNQIFAIASRFRIVMFYRMCREFIGMTESEISELKLRSLSKEDKYQLILDALGDKMLPMDVYAIINDKKRWTHFMHSRSWDEDALKFVGNRIERETIVETLEIWLLRRTEELGEKDHRHALEELHWGLDDFVFEENHVGAKMVSV